MNMETLSTINYDRLEELLRTKRFEELTADEKQWVAGLLSEEEYASMAALYTSMNEKQNMEMSPRPEIKTRLDKALAAKVGRPGLFQLKIPVYQSVAAALIFFLVGFGINFTRPVETKIVRNTVHVIKYISKPEEAKNLAIEAPKHAKKRITKGANTQRNPNPNYSLSPIHYSLVTIH